MNKQNEENEKELDQVEEELIRKEEKSRELPMLISGKSVFEIKKNKDKQSHTDG